MCSPPTNTPSTPLSATSSAGPWRCAARPGGARPVPAEAVAGSRVRAPREPRPRSAPAQPRGDGQPRPRPRGPFLAHSTDAASYAHIGGRRRALPRAAPPRAHHASGRGLGSAAGWARRRGRDRGRGPCGPSRNVPRPSPSTCRRGGSAAPGPAPSPAMPPDPARDPHHSADDLRPGWEARAEAVGLGPDALERRARPGPARPGPGSRSRPRRRGGRRTAVGAGRRSPAGKWCGRGADPSARGRPRRRWSTPRTVSSRSMPTTAAHADRVERRGVGERRYVVGARERTTPERGELERLLAARGMDIGGRPRSWLPARGDDYGLGLRARVMRGETDESRHSGSDGAMGPASP